MLIKNSAVKLLVTLCIILSLHAMEKDLSSITEMHTAIGSPLIIKKDYHHYRLIRKVKESLDTTAKEINNSDVPTQCDITRSPSLSSLFETLKQVMKITLQFGLRPPDMYKLYCATIITRFGCLRLIEEEDEYILGTRKESETKTLFFKELNKTVELELKESILGFHTYNITKIHGESLSEPQPDWMATLEDDLIKQARLDAMAEKYNQEHAL